jgi:hypothetical protein
LDEPTVKETIGKLLLEVIERGTLEEEDDSEEESDEDEYSEDDDDEDDRGKGVGKKEAKEVREGTNSREEDGNGNAERESFETSQTVQRCRNYESDARVHEV